MKKVAIITIIDYKNYGNRLQNYAAQEVIKSLGFSVETIINKTSTVENKQGKKKWTILGLYKRIRKVPLKNFYGSFMKKLRNFLNKEKTNEIISKRIANFRDFSNLFIKETNFVISENNIPSDLASKYDYFVTGSDQVWNPFFRYGSSVDFLTFAPKNKRIAYAPSFGISEIPNKYLSNYKKWLLEFQNLSVRESAGAEIIKKLTGKDVNVLIDPTLMLTKEQWLSISKPAANKPEKNFLLTYFLGGLSDSDRIKIRNIALSNDLQIVALVDIKDSTTYVTGPREFIDYIHSASILCTDSFHGVVFSILLETPFIIFDRNGQLPSMNSRIDTLMEKFKLNSRLAKNINNDEQVFEANYSHITPILEMERKKALNFLREAFDMEDI